MHLLSNSQFLQAQSIIQAIKNNESSEFELREQAVHLAKLVVQIARSRSSWKEKLQFSQLAAMMNDPVGKHLTTCLMDRIFRSHDPVRRSHILHGLLETHGIPRYLTGPARGCLYSINKLYDRWPKLADILMRQLVKFQTADVIVPANSLHKHLTKRKRQGTRVNLNHLGEAILGESEARKRLECYLVDLANPDVEYISVKISTLYSQISLLERKESLKILQSRLSTLYQQSLQHLYRRQDGSLVSKFVNLDMEEYRDLNLTIELFEQTLSQKEFLHTRAGIVLQSYLPDSFLQLERLLAFAKERRKQGGSPIKIRLVKGANLAMETLEAHVKGWPKATFDEKAQVDANFKKMLLRSLEAVKQGDLILGIGSHNLFDVCYVLLLREKMGLSHCIELEMLEGMAPQVRKVVQSLSNDMLVYCPCASEEEFHSAVAYLVRRLDENTGQENFLRHFFHLDVNPNAFEDQSKRFLKSFDLINEIEEAPRRKQNRLVEEKQPPILSLETAFQNEPDTDWSLPHNSEWIADHLTQQIASPLPTIPVVVQEKEWCSNLSQQTFEDPSRPGIQAFKTYLSNEELLEKALDTGINAFALWSQKDLFERIQIVHRSAQILRSRRGKIITAMVQSCAKTVSEADSEVSEAIDFVEYYTRQAKNLSEVSGLKLQARGLVAVISPWNFPAAIAMGGLVASLITGNSALFKPAPEATWVGYLIAQALWDAGIPRSVLQFLPCDEATIGDRLIRDSRLSAIVLTGATSTAQHFLRAYPQRHLIAETGGKNSMIITSTCDRDLAIRDLLHSAFSHSGQKCSSASLAILEAEVYDDARFWEQLIDGATSITVGSTWNMQNRMGPIIAPPSGKLEWALSNLEEGQSWVLKPQCLENNPRLWTPGIVKGVRAGQRRHLEEFFGPVLGVMRAENLDHAIDLANATPYGLTSGLHSLDEQEQESWQQKIIAGNLYINRPITGAIVARQPFGGTKASRIGHGHKAGGPHMLLSLTKDNHSENGHHLMRYPERFKALLQLIDQNWQEKLENCFRSYSFWYHHYTVPSQEVEIPGQDNLLFHVPQEELLIRWDETSSLISQLQSLAAVLLSHTKSIISTWQEPAEIIRKVTASHVDWIIESDELFISRLNQTPPQRLRFIGEAKELIYQVAAQKTISLMADPPSWHGRLEILHYMREVSFCRDYHRYGNLGLQPSK